MKTLWNTLRANIGLCCGLLLCLMFAAALLQNYMAPDRVGRDQAFVDFWKEAARLEKEAEEFAMAMEAAREAAEQGDPQAQYDLANGYLRGWRDVPPDDAKAAYWLHVSAEQGFAPAQVTLGTYHTFGWGEAFPQDYARAAYWYRKAAGQGYFYAQYSLAIMYLAGQGVARDYAKAAYWFLQVMIPMFVYWAAWALLLFALGLGLLIRARSLDKRKRPIWLYLLLSAGMSGYVGLSHLDFLFSPF